MNARKGRIGTMRTMPSAQGKSLLLLAIAVVLFFFSLTLLPAVEFYCRFIRSAIVLLILQILVLILRLYISPVFNRALVIATFVFTILGLAFNAFLLISVRGRC
jgi:hypothetical protein